MAFDIASLRLQAKAAQLVAHEDAQKTQERLRERTRKTVGRNFAGSDITFVDEGMYVPDHTEIVGEIVLIDGIALQHTKLYTSTSMSDTRSNPNRNWGLVYAKSNPTWSSRHFWPICWSVPTRRQVEEALIKVFQRDSNARVLYTVNIKNFKPDPSCPLLLDLTTEGSQETARVSMCMG